jgi:hypothetical protein
LELKPDMLLLTFYIGNDFTDCFREKKLYEYSYVATFINYLITLETKYEGIIIHAAGDYYNDSPSIEKETYLNIMVERLFMYFKGNAAMSQLNDAALHYLAAINDICIKKHIKIIVVIAPDEFQINDSIQTEVIKRFHRKLDRQNLDITLPIKLLTDGLDELGIKYINLYPYFKEKSGERLYKPQDTHWNIAGNQLVATIIQEHILRYIREFTTKKQ